jgi:hypothetical protein
MAALHADPAPSTKYQVRKSCLTITDKVTDTTYLFNQAKIMFILSRSDHEHLHVSLRTPYSHHLSAFILHRRHERCRAERDDGQVVPMYVCMYVCACLCVRVRVCMYCTHKYAGATKQAYAHEKTYTCHVHRCTHTHTHIHTLTSYPTHKTTPNIARKKHTRIPSSPSTDSSNPPSPPSPPSTPSTPSPLSPSEGQSSMTSSSSSPTSSIT